MDDPPGPSPPENRVAQTSSMRMPLTQKLSELVELVSFAIRRVRDESYGQQIVEALGEYERLAQERSGRDLAGLKVMEIGFGARPWRMAALLSRGCDAWGIDIDRPLLTPGVGEFARILKANGPERAVKSTLRSLFLDSRERRGIERRLGVKFDLRELATRLIVADASEEAAWQRFSGSRFDLILSEDVFEHIPSRRIPPLCRIMAQHMSDDSLALIRPFVFSGISGGHLAEWFAEDVDRVRGRRAAPWEHLRARRYRPNTYLNELRLADYRRLFSEDFDVLSEEFLQKDLGRRYLTPEIRDELVDYTDEELFANNVLFVLRKKRAPTVPASAAGPA